jgi:hypothetical protein
MKPLFAIVLSGMLCAGCASTVPAPVADRKPLDQAAPAPAADRNSLDQADAKLAAADYGGAQALYAEFVNANPADPQAVRVRAIQAALDRLLSAQTELERVKRSQEVPRLRRDLADRQAEVERLKAENTRLRADLERLRNIDLETLPGARK